MKKLTSFLTGAFLLLLLNVNGQTANLTISNSNSEQMYINGPTLLVTSGDYANGIGPTQWNDGRIHCINNNIPSVSGLSQFTISSCYTQYKLSSNPSYTITYGTSTIPSNVVTSYNVQAMLKVSVYQITGTNKTCANLTITYANFINGTNENGASINSTSVNAQATKTISIVSPSVTSTSVCRNNTLDVSTYANGFPIGLNDAVVGNIFYPDLASNTSTTINVNKTFVNGTVTSGFQVTRIDTVISGLFNEVPTVCGNALNYNLNNSVKSAFQNSGTFTGLSSVNGQNVVNGNLLNVTASGPGTFNYRYLYVNTSTGCTTRNNNQIKVYPLTTVNPGMNVVLCKNIDTYDFIDFTPTGGVWTGNGISGNTFNFASVLTGNYNFTYTYTDAANCNYSANKSVTVNGANFIKQYTNDEAFIAPVTVCGEQITNLIPTLKSSFVTKNGIFSSTINGGDFKGTNGSSYDNTNDISGFTTLLYYSYIDDVDGCIIRDRTTFKITTPQPANYGKNESVCVSSDLALNYGSPVGGTFTGTSIQSNSNIFNSSVPGLNAVTYSYLTEDFCTYSKIFNVTVNSRPSVNAGFPITVCGNGAVMNLKDASVLPTYGTFSGIGISNGLFNPKSYVSSQSPVSYSIGFSAISTSTGCLNSASRTVVITPVPTTTGIAQSTSICGEGSVTLSIGTPITNYNYNWYSTVSDPLPIYSGTSFTSPYLEEKINYYFAVTNTYNCISARDSVATGISFPDTPFSLSDTTLKIGSGIVDLKSFISKENVTVIGVGGKTIANNKLNTDSEKEGNFQVSYKYLNISGCVSSATQKINMSKTLGFSELEKIGIRVYPNPSKDKFTLNYPGKFTYEIHDVIGNLVQSGNANDVLVSEVELTGLYFVQLKGSNGTFTLKLIKE